MGRIEASEDIKFWDLNEKKKSMKRLSVDWSFGKEAMKIADYHQPGLRTKSWQPNLTSITTHPLTLYFLP